MNAMYAVVGGDDARAAKMEQADDVDGWAIYRFEPDKAPSFIGCDGGEPEDQLLCRDWAWVAHALNAEAARAQVATEVATAAVAFCAARVDDNDSFIRLREAAEKFNGGKIL